jgi:hypothetical protein
MKISRHLSPFLLLLLSIPAVAQTPLGDEALVNGLARSAGLPRLAPDRGFRRK